MASPIRNNPDPMTANEIRQNLAVMKSTIESKKIVDPKFLDIFREAIDALPKSEQKDLKKELNIVARRLDTEYQRRGMHNRVHVAASQAISSGDVKTARVGSTRPLAEMAADYQEGSPIKTGLINIERAGFICRPIRGDGHCQFRAVGAGLLLSCVDANAKQAKIEFIENQIDRLVGSQSNHPLNTLKLEIFTAINHITPDNAEDIVSEKHLSETMVAFLRLLASEETRLNPPDTLLPDLATRHITLEDYVNGMAQMNLGWYGGQDELLAMAKCLDMPLAVYDAAIYNDTGRHFVNRYNEGSQQAPLNLLFRSNHYDLLQPINAA